MSWWCSTWVYTTGCWPPPMAEAPELDLHGMLRRLHLTGMADNFADLAPTASRSLIGPRGDGYSQPINIYSMEMTDKIQKGMTEFVDFLHSLDRIKQKFPAEQVLYTKLLEEVDPKLVKWKSPTTVK